MQKQEQCEADCDNEDDDNDDDDDDDDDDDNDVEPSDSDNSDSEKTDKVTSGGDDGAPAEDTSKPATDDVGYEWSVNISSESEDDTTLQ